MNTVSVAHCIDDLRLGSHYRHLYTGEVVRLVGLESDCETVRVVTPDDEFRTCGTFLLLSPLPGAV